MNQETQQELRELADKLLVKLRDVRQEIMLTEDNSEGKLHSHGEVDNARGLSLRAISIAITQLEDASMWMIRSFFTSNGEYTPLQKLKRE